MSFNSVKKILKLKDNFSNLLFKKIENIYRTINDIGKMKSYINIITKNFSYKQIIIFIKNNNINKFIKTLDKYVVNFSYSLKSIKSNTIINFIYSNY